MLLGNASGKVGDLVFARRKGEQITRVKVDPANPQTLNQQLQRMSFATATQLAAQLRHIIDHSFEGIQEGQDSVNYFVKEAVKVAKRLSLVQYNTDNNPVVLNVAAPKSFDGAWPIPARISKGSLTPFSVSVDANGVATDDIYTEEGMKVGELLDVLGRGSYITAITIYKNGNKGAIYDASNTKLADVPNFMVAYARVKVKQSVTGTIAEDTVIAAGNLTDVINAIFEDIETSAATFDGTASSIVSISDESMTFDIAGTYICGTIIHSFENGMKTRSTQALVMNEEMLQGSNTFALPANISIQTWLGQASTNLDPAFLDGGDY